MLRFLAGRSTGALALAATLAVPLAMPAWAQHRDDRHGHVDRGGWHDHGGDHGGGGALVGGALVGLGLGALVGGAIAASQPAYPPPPAVYYAPQPAYVAPPPGAYYGY
jgi:hypothetical protein